MKSDARLFASFAAALAVIAIHGCSSTPTSTSAAVDDAGAPTGIGPGATASALDASTPPATNDEDAASVTPTMGDDASPSADASHDGGAALAARQRVLAYLAGISGHQTVVGIEDKSSTSPTADSDSIASITGKPPAFWSADWGFGSDAVDHRQTIVDEAKKQWATGAIVQFIYHSCPLTEDEYCSWDDIGGATPKHLSDAQWTDLVTPGTTLNRAWLARLDTLAPFFQQLRDAGIAPLFRVLHEMNQGVFWWAGRTGPNGTAKLFQITHDYLVGTKGLDNIVWVWNLQDFETLHSDVSAYAPGASYFDVAALDVYNTGYTTGNYDDMLGASGGKPIGIAECQFMPTADLLAQQPRWAYAALWPDFISENTSMLPALYGASNVVTLAAMPGWK